MSDNNQIDIVVSVAIVTLNRKDELQICINNIKHIDCKGLEILVFDNGSSDGTLEMLRDEFPDVQVIKAVENQGTCISRNKLAQLSSAPFFWFLDSDVEIRSSDILNRMLEYMQTNPNVAVVGGEGVVNDANEVIGVKSYHISRNGMMKGIRITDLEYGKFCSTEVLPTCNFFIRREVFEQSGGFDPFYFFYMEDRDISTRIRQFGWELCVMGKIPLVHKYSEKARKVDVMHIGKNRMYYLLQYAAWWELMLMPLLDLLHLFHPYNWFRTLRFSKERRRGILCGVTIKKQHTSFSSQVRQTVIKVYHIVGPMVLGYWAILPHLREAFTARRKHKKALQMIRSERYENS